MSAEHRRIVLDLLAEHLPAGGQRSGCSGRGRPGRARRYSDLDLAIDAGRRLTSDEAAVSREAFEECDLCLPRRYRRLARDRRALPPPYRRRARRLGGMIAPRGGSVLRQAGEAQAGDLEFENFRCHAKGRRTRDSRRWSAWGRSQAVD